MSIKNIAHIRKKANGDWDEPQLLKDHLEGTAKLAKTFASKFGNGDWGRVLGLWHDLGKYVPSWQIHRIRKRSGYDSEAHIEKDIGNAKVNHSEAGAVWAFKKAEKKEMLKGSAFVLAYVIAGHHAGLPDWYQETEKSASGKPLPDRIYEKPAERVLYLKDVEEISKIAEAKLFLSESAPLSPPFGVKPPCIVSPEAFHIWIRMLYSCLVDADFLDTEGYMNPKLSAKRGNYKSLRSLKKSFDTYMEAKKSSVLDSQINRERNKVLENCRQKAIGKSGFYTLTVPTGGGKTLSSMAFALEHAMAHNKSRIIYAIPYTSIIEQTAKIFKYGTDDDEKIADVNQDTELFGEHNVVEHHCNLDPEKETAANRLASENWDAPIIVTTNVQLFESLFASKSSRCRKLHNIAESIIILDEAQMLPPKHLRPILSVLQILVDYLGVTVVFCTATQPVITGEIGAGKAVIKGIEDCEEIIDNPGSLDHVLKRVDITFPQKPYTPKSWEELALELGKHGQVLCVVNTRSHCRKLHSLMPEGTMHLSALMCPEERSQIISQIKKKLRQKKSIRVVSTQLVEAGVDIDFPVVYRSMAGLDSIAQAAGRCNRENLLSRRGEVVVFLPLESAPPGLLRKGEDAVKEMLCTHHIENLVPELYTEYFKRFYGALRSFDNADFHRRFIKNACHFEMQFRTFDWNFNLIDDKDQRSIIVLFEGEYKSSTSLIDELHRLGPTRDLMRKLMGFTVTLSKHDAEKLVAQGVVENVHGYLVQSSQGLYKKGLGLILDEKEWAKEVLVE